MKFVDIITTANSNLFRSKLRTTLTILAIFIGSFTLTLTSGLGSGISSYLDKQLNTIGAKDVLIVTAKSASSNGTSDTPQKFDPAKQTATDSTQGNRTITYITDKDIKKIEAVSGIKSVTPYLSVNLTYASGPNGDKYLGSLNQYITGTTYPLEKGNWPSNSAKDREVMIPQSYVAPLGYKSAEDSIGKSITLAATTPYGTIREVKAIVVGVGQKSLISGNAFQANSTLNTELYDIQVEGIPKQTTSSYQQVVAKFDSSLTESEITNLKSELDRLGFTGQTIKDTIGILKTVISAIVWVLDGFAIIALLAASFGIINTLLMSVQERTKEIGLMKAMGMSSSRIFLLFSTEAVMLGFWGSLIGVGVAVLIGTIVNKIVINGILKDLVGLQLLTFPYLSIAYIVGAVMAIAFLAGTLPAIRAARQSPIDSLRYE